MDIENEKPVIQEAYELVKLLVDNIASSDPVIVESSHFVTNNPDKAHDTTYTYKNTQVMSYLAKRIKVIRWVNVIKTDTRKSSEFAYKIELYEDRCKSWLDTYTYPYEYKSIKLDVSRCKLYHKNKSLDITPSKREVVFLKILIENCENIVNYEKIATDLNLNNYSEGDKADTSVRTEIKQIKFNLLSLIEKGLGKDAKRYYSKHIKATPRIGYILK